MKTRTQPSTRIIALVLVAVAVLGLAFLHFRPHDDHRGAARGEPVRVLNDRR
jgi:hypothetical protein